MATIWSGRRRKMQDAVADDRGDVPGWVLITLMTVALAIAIWAIAGDALLGMFDAAMKSVRFT